MNILADKCLNIRTGHLVEMQIYHNVLIDSVKTLEGTFYKEKVVVDAFSKYCTLHSKHRPSPRACLPHRPGYHRRSWPASAWPCPPAAAAAAGSSPCRPAWRGAASGGWGCATCCRCNHSQYTRGPLATSCPLRLPAFKSLLELEVWKLTDTNHCHQYPAHNQLVSCGGLFCIYWHCTELNTALYCQYRVAAYCIAMLHSSLPITRLTPPHTVSKHVDCWQLLNWTVLNVLKCVECYGCSPDQRPHSTGLHLTTQQSALTTADIPTPGTGSYSWGHPTMVWCNVQMF